MPEPLDLGRTCLCLNARDLDAAAAFYERLGFRGGNGAASSRNRILRQSVTIIALFDFLKHSMLNYRGADIHRLVTELTRRGIQCLGHNAAPEVQLMLDKEGNPLPDNECGAFTVIDPDGYHVFFNTHPAEREPYRNGRWVPDESQADEIRRAAGKEPPLGTLIYRMDVRDLSTSAGFYENLGLSVVSTGDGSVTLGSLHPHMSKDPTTFPIRLRQAEAPGSALLFRSNHPGDVADSVRALGIDVADGPEGPVVTDPDGHQLLFIAA